MSATKPRPPFPGANAAALGLHTPARGLAFLAGYGHGRHACAAERDQLRRAVNHLMAAHELLGGLALLTDSNAVTEDLIRPAEAHP